MVGRREELKKLLELTEQIQEDQGQIVGIVADAGMGKSHLIREFREKVRHLPLQWIESASLSNASSPYEIFQKIIHQIAKERTQVFNAFLTLILDPTQPSDRLSQMTEEEIKVGIFSSVRSFFQKNLDRPHIIVLEDLHFAPPTTIELLQTLFEGLEELKLLLVLVHRPELNVTWDRRLNYNEIRLSPLQTEEIGEMAKDLLQTEEISLKLRNGLEKYTKGNPLFIQEILKHLVESDKLELDQNKNVRKIIRLEEESLQSIPSNIQKVILHRFSRLPQNLQNSLQAASLFGPQFSADDFETYAGKQDFTPLFERGFLSEKSSFPKRIHYFNHDLIYNVIRSTIQPPEKEERHTEIVHFLAKRYPLPSSEQADEIARHAMEAASTEEMTSHILTSANLMTASLQFSRAVSLYEGALSHWKKGELKLDTLQSIMSSYVDLILKVGDLKKARALLEMWEAEVPKVSGTSPEYAFLMMKIEAQSTHFDSALLWASRSLKFITQEKDPKKYLEILSTKAFALNLTGKNQEAYELALDTIETIKNRPEFNHDQIQLWLRAANALTSNGKADQALKFIQKAENLVDDKTSIITRLELLRRSILPLSRFGKHREAIERATRLIDQAKEYGFRQYMARAYMDRAIEWTEDGNYTDAFKDYEKALEEASAIHDESTEIRSLCGIFDNLLDLGVLNEAEELWNRHRERLLQVNNNWYLAVIYALYGTLLKYKGAYKESKNAYKKAQLLQIKIGSTPSYARTYLFGVVNEVINCKSSISKVIRDFDSFANKELKSNISSSHYHIFATAMFIASRGAKPKRGLNLKLNIDESPSAWLKQFSYVSTIRYLDSLGKKTEAKKFRNRYHSIRKEMAQRIPARYRDDFFNHPLYRVP